MKRTTIILPALLFMALVASGCVVRGYTGVHAHARVTAPELVYVSPGVHVVQDYHEPVFHSDGYYWRYHGGVWYRSHIHTGSWVRVRTVPVAVRRIERPHTYVRYRGNARVHHAPARVHHAPAPARVHHAPAPARVHRSNHHVRPAPRPAVRDHRTNVHVRSAPAQRRGPAVRDHRGGNGKVKVKVQGKAKVEVRDHR